MPLDGSSSPSHSDTRCPCKERYANQRVPHSGSRSAGTDEADVRALQDGHSGIAGQMGVGHAGEAGHEDSLFTKTAAAAPTAVEAARRTS